MKRLTKDHWFARTAPVAMVALLLAAGTTLQAAPRRASDTGAGIAPADSAAVAQTVERFHTALARGDSAAALALLMPDALIIESGDVETFAEYRAHHLPADIEFARAVPSTHSVLRVTVRADAAWVSSTSATTGTFRARAVNSAGAELVVLTRSSDGWRIAAIHWSSHRRGS